jgi:hypothetical protein
MSTRPFTISPERYLAAPDFAEYVDGAQKNVDLWRGLYRLQQPDEDLVARAAALPGRWHILVLSEDWCGDAVNIVPLVTRFVERLPNFDLRVLARDANPDIMDRHLTKGARSIPVVMLLDENFVERAWWGPRPSPLQTWRFGEGLSMPSPERTRWMRQWYARDRGRTTLEEIVAMLERETSRPAA